MVAERTRLAREQQKKAAAEANNNAKEATHAPPPAPTGESGGEKNSLLSTTQWLMLVSIVVSLAGLYYKREELIAKANAVFTKKTPAPESEPDPAPQTTGLIKMR